MSILSTLKDILSSRDVRESIQYIKDIIQAERDIQTEMRAFSDGYYLATENRYACRGVPDIDNLTLHIKHPNRQVIKAAYIAGMKAFRDNESHLRAKHNYFNRRAR